MDSSYLYIAPVKRKVNPTFLQLSRPWRYFRLLMIIRACQLRILPATSQRVTDVSTPVSPLLVADSKLIGCRRVTTRTDHRGSNGRRTLPVKYAKSSVHRGSPQDTLYGLAAGAHSDKSIRVTGPISHGKRANKYLFCFRDCMLPSEDPKRSRWQYAFLMQRCAEVDFSKLASTSNASEYQDVERYADTKHLAEGLLDVCLIIGCLQKFVLTSQTGASPRTCYGPAVSEKHCRSPGTIPIFPLPRIATNTPTPTDLVEFEPQL